MIKSEKGITLVELLAALALMSIVIALISSVHIFGQKQFTNESTQIENQSDVRFAINEITKDIRSGQTVSASNNILTVDTVEYELVNNKIMKNDNTLVENIEGFCVSHYECEGENKDEHGNINEINLKITSLPNQQGNSVSLSTVIYIRE